MSENESLHSASVMSRRGFLQSAAWLSGAIATGAGSWVIRPQWAHAADPIKVGIATDLTGAIGFAGNANANVARMVVKDINAKGGVLGRPLELFIEDTASNESVAVANVRKLIQRDKVDVVLGGITSSMRMATCPRTPKTSRIKSDTLLRMGMKSTSRTAPSSVSNSVSRISVSGR